MVKHIVMWNFGDVSDRISLAKEYKKEIESLVGVVPGLISCEAHYVMIDGSNSNMCLECVFESMEDLISYRTNPNHRSVGDKYKGKLLINKRVADFEI